MLQNASRWENPLYWKRCGLAQEFCLVQRASSNDLKVLVVSLQFGKKSSDRKSLPERHQLFSDVYDSYLASLFNGSYTGNLRGKGQCISGRFLASWAQRDTGAFRKHNFAPQAISLSGAFAIQLLVLRSG